MSNWHQQQSKDPYLKMRDAKGYRSRASFKLEQVLNKNKFIKNGNRIIELGSSPGGWSQVLAKVNSKGINIACDLLLMPPVNGVNFIQGDFLDSEIQATIKAIIHPELVDVIISDMAPNLSGDVSVDQYRAIAMWEMVLEFAEQILNPGGNLLIKVFQGVGFDDFLKAMRSKFQSVKSLKPDASKKSSREVYLLGTNFKV